MAYVGNDFSPISQIINGTFNTNVYLNSAADTIATILGANFISDGQKRGAKVGDVVWVLIGGLTVPCTVSALQALTSGNGITLALQGSGQAATAFQQVLTMPLQLKDIAAGTFQQAVPFAFKLNSVLFRTAAPASTASKLATLTAAIATVSVTGGVMALTTANQNTIGGTVAGSAITALNTGAAGATIGVTASAVTAFVEGDGWVEFNVTNLDASH